MASSFIPVVTTAIALIASNPWLLLPVYAILTAASFVQLHFFEFFIHWGFPFSIAFDCSFPFHLTFMFWNGWGVLVALVSHLTRIMAVYGIHGAHSAEPLFSLLSVAKFWEILAPVVTLVLALLIQIPVQIFALVWMPLSVMASDSGTRSAINFMYGLFTCCVLVFLLFYYFTIVFSMSVVVSVVEANCFLFCAVGKAWVALSGIWWQTYLTAVVALLLCAALDDLSLYASDWWPKLKVPVRVVCGALIAAVHMFYLAILTVVYLESQDNVGAATAPLMMQIPLMSNGTAI